MKRAAGISFFHRHDDAARKKIAAALSSGMTPLSCQAVKDAISAIHRTAPAMPDGRAACIASGSVVAMLSQSTVRVGVGGWWLVTHTRCIAASYEFWVCCARVWGGAGAENTRGSLC